MNDINPPTPPVTSPKSTPTSSSLPLPPEAPSTTTPKGFLDSLLLGNASLSPLKVVGKVPNDIAIRKIKNIPYAHDDEKQKLDIYLPAELVPPSTSTGAAWEVKIPSPKPRPVYIHIHGGGWARGGKGKYFFGAPPLCEAQAANGCICVAPGYRLRQHPDFLHDVALSFKWVKDNIAKLGGDLDNVFVSGHSAGAHIISLLLVRFDDYLKPLGLEKSWFKGLVLVSGVFSLFSPLRKELLDVKNKGFVLAYVYPTFGLDETVRRSASPLILLEPDTPSGMSSLAGKLYTEIANKAGCDIGAEAALAANREVVEELSINKDLPPALVFNCQFDFGLQANGKAMFKAWQKYNEASYVSIPRVDHGGICRSNKTHTEIHNFMKKNYKPCEG
mmetsp:Transcript_22288/g.46319  ORF Transcript_22288/g.46319 Transcript_22288/m.46319 type:complete len:388 (+) Transcript_22288:37-1200(+)